MSGAARPDGRGPHAPSRSAPPAAVPDGRASSFFHEQDVLRFKVLRAEDTPGAISFDAGEEEWEGSSVAGEDMCEKGVAIVGATFDGEVEDWSDAFAFDPSSKAADVSSAGGSRSISSARGNAEFKAPRRAEDTDGTVAQSNADETSGGHRKRISHTERSETGSEGSPDSFKQVVTKDVKLQSFSEGKDLVNVEPYSLRDGHQANYTSHEEDSVHGDASGTSAGGEHASVSSLRPSEDWIDAEVNQRDATRASFPSNLSQTHPTLATPMKALGQVFRRASFAISGRDASASDGEDEDWDAEFGFDALDSPFTMASRDEQDERTSDRRAASGLGVGAPLVGDRATIAEGDDDDENWDAEFGLDDEPQAFHSKSAMTSSYKLLLKEAMEKGQQTDPGRVQDLEATRNVPKRCCIASQILRGTRQRNAMATKIFTTQSCKPYSVHPKLAPSGGGDAPLDPGSSEEIPHHRFEHWVSSIIDSGVDAATGRREGAHKAKPLDFLRKVQQAEKDRLSERVAEAYAASIQIYFARDEEHKGIAVARLFFRALMDIQSDNLPTGPFAQAISNPEADAGAQGVERGDKQGYGVFRRALEILDLMAGLPIRSGSIHPYCDRCPLFGDMLRVAFRTYPGCRELLALHELRAAAHNLPEMLSRDMGLTWYLQHDPPEAAHPTTSFRESEGARDCSGAGPFYDAPQYCPPERLAQSICLNYVRLCSRVASTVPNAKTRGVMVVPECDVQKLQLAALTDLTLLLNGISPLSLVHSYRMVQSLDGLDEEEEAEDEQYGTQRAMSGHYPHTDSEQRIGIGGTPLTMQGTMLHPAAQQAAASPLGSDARFEALCAPNDLANTMLAAIGELSHDSSSSQDGAPDPPPAEDPASPALAGGQRTEEWRDMVRQLSSPSAEHGTAMLDSFFSAGAGNSSPADTMPPRLARSISRASSDGVLDERSMLQLLQEEPEIFLSFMTPRYLATPQRLFGELKVRAALAMGTLALQSKKDCEAEGLLLDAICLLDATEGRPSWSKPLLLTPLGPFVLERLGEAFTRNRKGKFGILAFQESLVLHEVVHQKRHDKVIRRLCSVSLEEGDAKQACAYHFMLLEAARDQGNVNEFTYLCNVLSQLLLDAGFFLEAEQYLRVSFDVSTGSTPAALREVVFRDGPSDGGALGRGASSGSTSDVLRRARASHISTQKAFFGHTCPIATPVLQPEDSVAETTDEARGPLVAGVAEPRSEQSSPPRNAHRSWRPRLAADQKPTRGVGEDARGMDTAKFDLFMRIFHAQYVACQVTASIFMLRWLLRRRLSPQQRIETLTKLAKAAIKQRHLALSEAALDRIAYEIHVAMERPLASSRDRDAQGASRMSSTGRLASPQRKSSLSTACASPEEQWPSSRVDRTSRRWTTSKTQKAMLERIASAEYLYYRARSRYAAADFQRALQWVNIGASAAMKTKYGTRGRFAYLKGRILQAQCKDFTTANVGANSHGARLAEEAATAFKNALSLYSQTNDLRHKIKCRARLAEIHLSTLFRPCAIEGLPLKEAADGQGETILAECERQAVLALESVGETGDPLSIVMCLINMAEVHHLRGRSKLAYRTWRECVTLIGHTYCQRRAESPSPLRQGEDLERSRDLFSPAGTPLNDTLYPTVLFPAGMLLRLHSHMSRLVRLPFVLRPPSHQGSLLSNSVPLLSSWTFLDGLVYHLLPQTAARSRLFAGHQRSRSGQRTMPTRHDNADSFGNVAGGGGVPRRPGQSGEAETPQPQRSKSERAVRSRKMGDEAPYLRFKSATVGATPSHTNAFALDKRAGVLDDEEAAAISFRGRFHMSLVGVKLAADLLGSEGNASGSLTACELSDAVHQVLQERGALRPQAQHSWLDDAAEDVLAEISESIRTSAGTRPGDDIAVPPMPMTNLERRCWVHFCRLRANSRAYVHGILNLKGYREQNEREVVSLVELSMRHSRDIGRRRHVYSASLDSRSNKLSSTSTKDPSPVAFGAAEWPDRRSTHSLERETGTAKGSGVDALVQHSAHIRELPSPPEQESGAKPEQLLLPTQDCGQRSARSLQLPTRELESSGARRRQLSMNSWDVIGSVKRSSLGRWSSRMVDPGGAPWAYPSGFQMLVLIDDVFYSFNPTSQETIIKTSDGKLLSADRDLQRSDDGNAEVPTLRQTMSAGKRLKNFDQPRDAAGASALPSREAEGMGSAAALLRMGHAAQKCVPPPDDVFVSGDDSIVVLTELLGPQRTLFIVTALLLEQPVLVLAPSGSEEILMYAMTGLLRLIRPIQWQHRFVPLLHMSAAPVLSAAISSGEPFLMGTTPRTADEAISLLLAQPPSTHRRRIDPVVYGAAQREASARSRSGQRGNHAMTMRLHDLDQAEQAGNVCAPWMMTDAAGMMSACGGPWSSSSALSKLRGSSKEAQKRFSAVKRQLAKQQHQRPLGVGGYMSAAAAAYAAMQSTESLRDRSSSMLQRRLADSRGGAASLPDQIPDAHGEQAIIGSAVLAPFDHVSFVDLEEGIVRSSRKLLFVAQCCFGGEDNIAVDVDASVRDELLRHVIATHRQEKGSASAAAGDAQRRAHHSARKSSGGSLSPGTAHGPAVDPAGCEELTQQSMELMLAMASPKANELCADELLPPLPGNLRERLRQRLAKAVPRSSEGRSEGQGDDGSAARRPVLKTELHDQALAILGGEALRGGIFNIMVSLLKNIPLLRTAGDAVMDYSDLLAMAKDEYKPFVAMLSTTAGLQAYSATAPDTEACVKIGEPRADSFDELFQATLGARCARKLHVIHSLCTQQLSGMLYTYFLPMETTIEPPLAVPWLAMNHYIPPPLDFATGRTVKIKKRLCALDAFGCLTFFRSRSQRRRKGEPIDLRLQQAILRTPPYTIHRLESQSTARLTAKSLKTSDEDFCCIFFTGGTSSGGAAGGLPGGAHPFAFCFRAELRESHEEWIRHIKARLVPEHCVRQLDHC